MRNLLSQFGIFSICAVILASPSFAVSGPNRQLLKYEFCGFPNPALRLCTGFNPADGKFYIERATKNGQVSSLPLNTRSGSLSQGGIVYQGVLLAPPFSSYQYVVTVNQQKKLIAAYQYLDGQGVSENYTFPVKKMGSVR